MDVRYLSVPSLAEFSCFRVGFHARIFYPLWRLLAVNISWKVYLTSNMRIAFPLLDPFIYTPHHRSIHFNKSRSFKSSTYLQIQLHVTLSKILFIAQFIWYPIVTGISHDIVFGMCHVRAYHMTMWYAFWPCGLVCDHVVWFFKTIENFNLEFLKVRNDYKYSIKRKPYLCGVWGNTPHFGSPAVPYSIFSLMA